MSSPITKNGSASESAQAPAQATEDAALPNSEAEIEKLRKEIDRLDAEILAAIKRRTEISRIIGRTRLASGGTRLVHSREMKVLERFSELGQEGHTLAMLLLRLGRGRLGH
ncbi:chorismate mutase [Skermania sp. ID1734]|uniref:chorismate mutase n=1 Tax=Skermania sp. ID1734 TaxID=2597516 RepID=UPI00210496D3|nr:chorismate mutase [Skermania sp. ID1734]